MSLQDALWRKTIMSKIRRKGRSTQTAETARIASPILLIEDTRSISAMAAAMLKERWDCEVHIAATFEEANTLLETNGKDYMVAICDLNLPDAPHGEVIDLVTPYGIPVIAVTGIFGDELREMIVKKGVTDYVLKEGPSSYEYITNLVGRLYRNQFTKALVVDDSISARAVLKHMLTLQHLKVLTANNGKEALEVLEENPDIRIVLTDYMMPEMDGHALTMEIRKKTGKDRMCIIGVSGTDEGRISARFLKLGANDFITKPFSYEELFCRVSQNLEMLEQIETIWNAANRDYLTGLFNRRHFFTSGEDLYERVKARKQDLTVAMLDIDFFKAVNDKHGHDVGDAVLRHLASLLAQYFKKHLVARLGGEEFAVILKGVDLNEARQLLETFRQAVESIPAQTDAGEIAFTISAGLTDQAMDNLDEMLALADQQLYRAKESGRNRVV